MPDEKAMQEAMAAVQSALAAGKTDPLEIHIGHQTYKGTPGEIAGELIKAQFHATETIKSGKEELEARQKTIDAMTATLQEKAVTPAKTTGYDDKRYWQLMENDPVAAERYKMSYVLFDGNVAPEDLPATVGRMNRVREYIEGVSEIQTFLIRHPEFPGGDEATDLIFKEIQDQKQEANAQNIEYHYLRLVNDKKITPLSSEEVTKITGAPERVVPPSLPGSSGATGQSGYTEAQLLSMPRAEFDKLVEAGTFRKQ